MNKLNKLSILLFIIVFICSGIAFAGGEEEAVEEKGVEKPEEEVTTLRIWKFGSPQHERAYLVYKNELFLSRNPDIEIEWSYQVWGTKRTKVITSHQANNLPDILCIDGQSIPDFVEMGIILPLDEVDKAMVEKWRPRFDKETWDTGVYKGKVYALSTYVDTAPMFAYNTRMFREAGIVDSEGNARPPKDWDEMIKIAKDFTKGGIYGIALPASQNTNDINIFEGVAYRNGGRWLDGDRIVINGRGFVDTLKLYKELSNYAPSGFTDTNFRDASELFFQGKTAMLLTMSFAPMLKAQFEVSPDFEYKIAPVPLRKTKSGKYAKSSFIMTPTHAIMVTRQVGNKKVAMRYLDFWATKEAQEGWSGKIIEGLKVLDGRVPILKENLESEDFTRIYPDLSKEYKKGTLFEGALPMPGFPGLTEAETKLSVALQEVLLGVKAPQIALDDLQRDAQAIYDKAKK